MAKLVYNGPEGMAVAGQPLTPGEEVELDDDVAEGLKDHPWFNGDEEKAEPTARRSRKRGNGSSGRIGKACSSRRR